MHIDVNILEKIADRVETDVIDKVRQVPIRRLFDRMSKTQKAFDENVKDLTPHQKSLHSKKSVKNQHQLR